MKFYYKKIDDFTKNYSHRYSNDMGDYRDEGIEHVNEHVKSFRPVNFFEWLYLKMGFHLDGVELRDVGVKKGKDKVVFWLNANGWVIIPLGLCLGVVYAILFQ